MNCSPFKSRTIVGSAAPIPVYMYMYIYIYIISASTLRPRRKGWAHEFDGGQEDGEREGEDDAPELPVLWHGVIVMAVFGGGRSPERAGEFGIFWFSGRRRGRGVHREYFGAIARHEEEINGWRGVREGREGCPELRAGIKDGLRQRRRTKINGFPVKMDG